MIKPIPVEQADGLIYYARRGADCKIGYTTKLAQRMQQLKPVELLAVEYGTMSAEWYRHEVFAQLRSSAHKSMEWFRYEGELREYVESLPVIEPYLQYRADLLERRSPDTVAVHRAWGNERRREGYRRARAARSWSPNRPHQGRSESIYRALEETTG